MMLAEPLHDLAQGGRPGTGLPRIRTSCALDVMAGALEVSGVVGASLDSVKSSQDHATSSLYRAARWLQPTL